MELIAAAGLGLLYANSVNTLLSPPEERVTPRIPLVFVSESKHFHGRDDDNYAKLGVIDYDRGLHGIPEYKVEVPGGSFIYVHR